VNEAPSTCYSRGSEVLPEPWYACPTESLACIESAPAEELITINLVEMAQNDSKDRATAKLSESRPPSLREILRLTGDKGVDPIVMGTRGRTGLRHGLMGSVAGTVMRPAPCPMRRSKAVAPVAP
jgi:nucleotide-binding universal stress UspA family protein